MLEGVRVRGSIHDYYSAAAREMREEVAAMDDDYVLRVDLAELRDFLVAKYALPRLNILDDAVTIAQDRLRQTETNRFGEPYTREEPLAVVRMPLAEADGIEEALRLRPSRTNLNPPGITLEGTVIVGRIPNPTPDLVARFRADVGRWLGWRNEDIDKLTADLRQTAEGVIAQRKEQVATERAAFADLAKATGIPLRRKADARAAAIDLSVRRTVAVKRTPPAPKRPEEQRLTPEALQGILDEVQRIGRQFEVAPEAYADMGEERLRDVIVGLLNHVFDVGGVATGEAFRKTGKSDIQVVVGPGAVFTAECKWWGGAKAYLAALDQLFGYLTWRDSDAALITFVRERAFTEIIRSAIEAAAGAPSTKGGPKKVTDTHYVSEHARPDDPDRRLVVHHLFFTIPRRQTPS